MTWTHFHDMHSGGRQKLKWGNIFIEGDEASCRKKFQSMFGIDPDNVTCDCCGADYSVSEETTLERATAFNRNCTWDSSSRQWAERGDPTRPHAPFISLDKYAENPTVRIVPLSELAR